jgi:two-component system chemotaxis response regulator CheY
MRILIVEDDFISRRILKEILSEFGECTVVVDGAEAVQEFTLAIGDGKPYDIIFLDIMLPNVDGLEALKQIRDYERSRGTLPSGEVKVVMTTALDDPRTVVDAYYQRGADSYLVKPITRARLVHELKKTGLVGTVKK